MKNRYKYIYYLLIVWCTISLTACESFLDEKPDKSMLIPNKLSDLQALLDNIQFINNGYYPGLLEVATDDVLVKEDIYGGLNDFEKKIYIWDPSYEYIPLRTVAFWKNPYFPILMANTVLEELESMQGENPTRASEIKGSALFLRSFSFFTLALVFGQEYTINTEPTGMGIPLRMTADFTVKSERASIKQTMERVIDDLQESLNLLPEKTEFSTQPTLAAAHALLARVYLYMGKYSEAAQHADLALQQYDVLLDFKTISPSNPVPFEVMNEETIFYAVSSGNTMLNPIRSDVSTDLTNQYTIDDFRKGVFFQDSSEDRFTFKGSYSGFLGGTFFVGLATDELYLILAECLVRIGDTKDAESALSKLLTKRYNNYEAPSEENSQQLLIRILNERRKELVMRGLRWYDLRRLNQDERFAKTLTRVINVDGIEKIFVLKPRDARYAFQIPQEVIDMSGIAQNPM